jgi:hypothetical protein
MRTIRNLVVTEIMVAAAASAALLCSPSKSVAGTDESIHITAYDAEGSKDTHYTWSATGGKLQAHDAEADWILSDPNPGSVYSIQVSAKAPAGVVRECAVQIGIRSGARGDRETARTLLARGKAEEPGFGLYSYLLLGSAPDDTSRDRYLNVVKEYLRLSPALTDMSKLLDAKQLNANYLPVMTMPRGSVLPTAEWLLANYDYARARSILKTVAGSHFRGPYILSTLKPADPESAAPGPMFFQDLTSVPLDLITPWYEVFLNQAAQQRFWEPDKAEQFTLKVRTIIGVLARGLPEVKSSLSSWIQWLH